MQIVAIAVAGIVCAICSIYHGSVLSRGFVYEDSLGLPPTGCWLRQNGSEYLKKGFSGIRNSMTSVRCQCFLPGDV